VAAIKALQGRANLTEEMVLSIAAQLEHEYRVVREAAVQVLVNQTVLSLEILGPYVKPLYKALLQKSFTEHLYWYASNRAFIGVGLRLVPLICKQEHQPSEKIWEIRNNLGVPLSTS
jgi:hypothetical protein